MARGPKTVGDRLREARESREMSQQQVANHLGLSRAAITQWETDTTSPSLHKIIEAAKFLQVKPEWLAFGVSMEAKVEYRDPEDMGFVVVTEYAFGERVDQKHSVGSYAFPKEYLGEINCTSPNATILWRVDGTNMENLYEAGDRVIIDTSQRRPASGIFLIWDGFGPALHDIAVRPVDGKMSALVSSRDGRTQSYETDPSKLAIIGRVRGVLKKV